MLPRAVPKGPGRERIRARDAPAAKALGVLLTGAAWMGKGPRPAGRAPMPVIVAEPVRSGGANRRATASGSKKHS